MLESYTEQENQTPVFGADQEYGMSSTAQSVDDNSSRNESLAFWTDQENVCSNTAQNVNDNSLQSEKLQNISNAFQGKDEVPRKPGNEFILDNKKRFQNKKHINLLNSESLYFWAQTYETSYSVEFYLTKFRVKYIPQDHKLYIVMPVKFEKPTNLNDGSNELLDDRVASGLMSSRILKNVKNAYKNSIRRVWSEKHELHLNAVFPEENKSCYGGWACISPVKVCVSVNEEPNNADAYKIYYVNRDDYRDFTWSDHVIFSKNAYKNRYADRHDEQNIFAHEFGHQIGLGDEYAVNYKRADVQYNGETKNVCVYRNSVLNAYERTGGIRLYTLSTLSGKKALFNHDGFDYSAEKMTFNENNREYTGYVLKNANGNELRGKLPGLKSSDPDKVGEHCVYLYQDILEAEEKPGARAYDLEKFNSNGGKIHHNYGEYSVEKDSDSNGDFYYLVDANGNVKDEWLDGTYTSHFDMVKDQFGEAYALKHATMFNEVDLLPENAGFSGRDEKGESVENSLYIMNENGNDVKTHHYLPFLKGMVRAIQSKYPSVPSEKAPNMEKDWKIE